MKEFSVSTEIVFKGDRDEDEEFEYETHRDFLLDLEKHHLKVIMEYDEIGAVASGGIDNFRVFGTKKNLTAWLCGEIMNTPEDVVEDLLEE